MKITEALKIIEHNQPQCDGTQASVDNCYAYDEAYRCIEAALKAQEPRVMTLDEISDLKWHDMLYLEFKNPTKEIYKVLGGFVEQKYKDSKTSEVKAIDIIVGINEMAHLNIRNYLNDFRIWTAMPTSEQMEETPWDK